MISSKVNKYKPKQIQKRFSSILSFFQEFSSGEESIFQNQARLNFKPSSIFQKHQVNLLKQKKGGLAVANSS